MRLEIDERYLPAPHQVGDYISRLLVGTGNDLTMRWAAHYERDMNPFPREAEEAYWRKHYDARLRRIP